MNNTNRDFNLVAKILLGLSMFAVVMAIITSFQKIGLNSYFLGGNTALIIEIVIDFLILIAAILTFMKKRFGLIALATLFIIRMFATIPYGGDIAYSYQLGGKMVYFFRDFGLFAIALCFKKDGISGWRSMLKSTNQQDDLPLASTELDMSGIDENKIKAESQTTEKNDDFPQTNDFDSKCQCAEEDTMQQDFSTNDSLTHESIAMELSGQPSEKAQDVEGLTRASSKHGLSVALCNLFGRINKKAIVKIVIPSILIIGGAVSVIVVLSKDYPKNISSFGDKCRYCLSLPNNKLSREYFEKYQKAKDSGLEELCKEYLTTAWDAKPNDSEILDSLSKAFFLLGRDSDDGKCYYEKAEEVCLKMLKKNPSNESALDRLARVYYNTEQNEKAYRIGEQLLIEDPNNGLGLDLMCRKAYYGEDWESLQRWGKKGYDLGKDATSFWSELAYFYAKGLFETGYKFDAMKLYSEAEKSDASSWLHKEFVKIGGIPCTISSIQVKNETYDGKIIHKAGAYIYDDNTRYLTPVIKLKANRTGRFYFDVKLFANGKMSTGSDSPSGYTYRDDLYLWESDKEITTELMGWGSDSPGNWESGGYRIEIWWEGERLYSYTFNIYSGFWHNLGYSNRLD